MISVSLHDADRLIAINGGQFLGEFKYAVRFYILLIARVRDLLEKSLGYGMLKLVKQEYARGMECVYPVLRLRFIVYI